MDLLSSFPAAMCTVQDAESAILFTLLPHMPPACTLVSNKELWHTRMATSRASKPRRELLAAHPAALLTAHDAESTIPVTPPPNVPSAFTLVTEPFCMAMERQ